MVCKSKAAEQELAKAWVCVAEPTHLCRVQRATRALCRSAGFSESDVYQAVIAVTDLAFGLYVERAQRVDLALSALRHEYGLELRAESADPARRPPLRVSFPFPFGSAPERPAARLRGPARPGRARAAFPEGTA